jgi:AsmA protein
MRIAKILLAVVASIAALLVIGTLIVASLFDPNDYKGVVTDAFTARTGRTLAIEQDLRLAYFPWLAVETGGVTVGSASDFGGAAQPFATVERVAARVKLLPLLERRVEIGTVELTGLTLNLARDTELRGNWHDLVETAAGDPAGASLDPVDSATPSVTSFAIEGIRVSGGNVYWRENTDELRYSVTALDLSTGGIGNDEPVAFDAALQFKDEVSGLTAALTASAVVRVTADGSVAATDVDAAVTLNAGGGAPARELEATATQIVFASETQTLQVEGLTTATAGVTATWQVAGTALIDNPTVQGSVTVAPAPLAAVFDELGWSPPQGVAADELGDFALSAQFRVQNEPRTITVSGVDAELLGMRVRGEGTLTGATALAGRVEIPEFTPNSTVQALLRAAVPPTVDVSALDTLALSTRFDSDLDTGRAALRELQANVFGATIRANLEALPGDRGNIFRGSVTTSRFAADAFAAAFASMLPPNLAASELGMLEIDTRFAFDTGTDSVSLAPFTAEAFGLEASGEATGRGVSTAAAWTGTAKVAQFSPQDLLRRFGLPPQPTSDDRALTRATIDTRFNVTKDRAELTDVVLALDDSKITGNFTLDGFDQPDYRFALAVDRVDADRYLPPKARDAQAGEATAGDIELPQNNTMNLDGTMQIGTLRLAGMQFQDVGSRILIGNGDAKLENARARLYGGEFNGNFHVRAAGNEPGLALDGRASGLQLQPLIEALTGEAANFSGTGNFDLNLAGKGRTVIQNVQTAAGNVSFAMNEGAIQGFNLGRTLCAAYNATQRAPAPAERPQQTEYEAIQGTAVVTAGTARSQDLLARTSFMDISGAGTLGLVEQTLDYDLDAKLTGSIGIPGCETLDGFVGDALPFDISGTVTEPTITPDFSKLVQRALRNEVQERLQERIQDRLRDILR